MDLPNRRRFLVAASKIGATAVSAFALTKPALALPSRGDETRSLDGFMRWIESRFVDPEAARAVGQHYLARNPHYRDRGRLMRELFGNDAAASHETLRSTYVSRCSDDFERHNVALVDGWLFAETEVKLCALLAQM